jgi:hypothetical protein
MATTPEAKVKAKIHAALKASGAYAVNYIGGQYANNGTPDILACLNSRFIGIEAKAGRGKPTALQIKNLRTINAAGGLALVINETNLDYLKECLDEIIALRPAQSNYHLFAPAETADSAGTEAD